MASTLRCDSFRPAGTKAVSTPWRSAQATTSARVASSVLHVEQAGGGGTDAGHALRLRQGGKLFGVFDRQAEVGRRGGG